MPRIAIIGGGISAFRRVHARRKTQVRAKIEYVLFETAPASAESWSPDRADGA